MRLIENHFLEYKEICDDIYQMAIELRFKKENLYSLTGIKYGDIIKSTKRYGLESAIMEIEKLEKKLEVKDQKKKCIRKKHEEELSKIVDSRERDVLEYYYLDFLKISQISKIMRLSDSYIKSLKSSAIKNFEKIILNNTK